MEATRYRYGDHDSQVCDLHRPGPDAARVVVLIHGGFWRQRYGLEIMGALIPSLLAEGWAVWNIEYRRVGGCGGWPFTFDDVAQAMDLLAAVDPPVNLDNVAVVGHSAGGHLALWAASRGRLQSGSPGAAPAVTPTLAVSVAGMGDLRAAVDLGAGAALALMGTDPDADPAAWTAASPAERLPLGVRQVLVHGSADDIVPVDRSRGYAAAAEAAGDDVVLDVIEGDDHFAVLDPTSATWGAVLGHLRGAP
jgi:acetyl esterase/lipase